MVAVVVSVILVTSCTTVTEVGFETTLDPSVAAAVIRADPGPSPVTTPASLTEATPLLLDCQDRAVALALLGSTVAVSLAAEPTVTVVAAGIVTPVISAFALLVAKEPPPHPAVKTIPHINTYAA
jgi:hypothetical protein